MAETSSHASFSLPHEHEFEMAEHKAAHFEVVGKTKELPADEEAVDQDPDFEGTKSTAQDRLAMQRLGKKQQLVVLFNTSTHDSEYDR